MIIRHQQATAACCGVQDERPTPATGDGRRALPDTDLLEAPHIISGLGNAISLRFAHPFERFRKVAFHTNAIDIAQTQTVLRTSMTLLCRKVIPLHRFGVVLRNAIAINIASFKVVLRTGITLLGSEAIPLHRFGVILHNTIAIIIASSKVVLRIS